MKETLGYFTCDDGVIWTVFSDGTSNYLGNLRTTADETTVQVLGEYDGNPSPETPRLIEAEYTLWPKLLDLSAHIEAEVNGASLTELRADLKHQLAIPDELDWSYFLETAARTLVEADKTAKNMIRIPER